MHFLYLTFNILFVPLISFAGGSVSFSGEMVPLLNGRPEILQSIQKELDVRDIGEGARMGVRICPGLAGKKISPYIFEAKDRKNKNKIILTIKSNIDFYDHNGNIVFQIINGVPGEGDPYEAVAFKESFSSLVVHR